MVLYQEMPGQWVGRGIEHDVTAEGRSIGETVRAVLRMLQAHIAFDERHDREPLRNFRPAPQLYWNAYSAGTQVPLDQLGALPPPHWEIAVAIARYRPMAARPPIGSHASISSSL